MTNTEPATAKIMTQSVEDNGVVVISEPMAREVNGIVASASCTKNNSNPSESMNATLIHLFENKPSLKALSQLLLQFITLNN